MRGNLEDGLRKAEGAAGGLERTLGGLKHTLAGAFAVGGVSELARKIIDARGEIESLQISFETLAGVTKGRELFGEIRQFAVSTPMQMQDLAKGAQTLLGFNIEAEKVMPILRQIGDISMGDAQKFNALTLAFAQMSSTGKLMGQDLLQMINAGFNPLTVIAEKTGKSIGKLKEEMASGKISVEMVADAFATAAGEGGKFHGMLEKQSKGLKGALSNLEGAWNDALNEMGEQGEGVMVDVIDLATAAVQHFDKLGTAILTVVTAYGAYKGSLMAVEALQNAVAAQKASIEATRVSELESLVAEYRSVLDADASAQASDTAATAANTAAKEGNAAAIHAEIAAIEEELRAKIAAAEAEYQAAVANESSAIQRTLAAEEFVQQAEEKYAAALKSGDGLAIESAENALNTATQEANAAARATATARAQASAAMTAKATAQQKLNTLQTQVDTVQKNANTAATGLWAAATRMATTAMQGLKAAFMSNPIGMALVAITSMIGVLSMFTSKTDDASDAMGRFREKVLQEDHQLRQYIAILRTTEKGTKSWKEAMEGINKTAREYNTALLDVNDTADEQARKLDSLSEAIRRTTAEKTLAEAASKAQDDAMEREKEAMERLMEQASKATHGSGVIEQRTGSELKATSAHIRTVTAATWNAISGITMEYSGKITEAFKQSGEAGEQAIAEVVARIEDVLRASGATDAEIKGFHASLTEYVTASADGFRESSNELERTQAQLSGLARATEEARDRTNVALSDMSYDQLLEKLIETKSQINQLNAKPLQPQVGDMSGIYNLRNTLVEIRQLMGQTINKGSISDLENRITDLTKRLKDSTDPIERNILNQELLRLQQSKRQMVSQYSALNSGGDGRTSRGKSGTTRTGRTKDPAQSKYEQERSAQTFMELQEEQARDRVRAARDAEFEFRQANIDLMAEGTKRTVEQLELDFDKQKEEIRRGYEDLITEKIAQARRLFESDPKNKNKVFTYNRQDYSLTVDERKLYGTMGADGKISGGALLAAAQHEYDEGVRDAYAAEAQAMRDFLKEYGNYQQRKQAIAEDYAERIRKAQTEGERLRLQKEQEEQQRAEQSAINEYLLLYGSYQQKKLALNEEYAQKISKAQNAGERLSLERELEDKLSELDMSELEKSINWEAVFNGLDKMSIEHLKTLKVQLKEALNAKDITAENAAIISERINTINGQIQQKSKEWQSAFGLVIPELEKIRRLERESEEAQERLAEAKQRHAEALKEEAETRRRILELLKKEGIASDESQITATGQDAFIGQMQAQGKDVTALTALFAKLGKQERDVVKKTGELSQATTQAGIAADAAKRSFSDTVAIIDNIVQVVNSNLQSSNELFEQMGLADTKFGKGWSAFAESGRYAAEAWNSLKSGDFMGAANGVFSSLRELGNALGAFGIGGFGDSDANLLRDIELLTQSNADLKQAIDNLANEMGEAKMSDVAALYAIQKENIEKVMVQTREAMSRSAAAYSGGFIGIGGKHSSNKKIDDGMSAREWDAISALVGRSIRSAGDFWLLTSKEMYEVATKLTAEYTHLKTLADDGYRDAAQYMDEYIDLWKELEEIENAYLEKRTGLSFDGLRSSFANLVKDVKNGTQEVLASVDEMLGDAMLNWLTSEKYNAELQDWYTAFAAAMADGLERTEADNLRAMYKQIVDDYTQERDAVFKAAGVTPTDSGTTQSGRSGSFETMTQDQGTKLEGLFTSGQRHWASMDDLLGRIADHWGGLQDRLRDLVENTGYCRHLSDIANDIQAMRRDGLKMR